MTATRLARAAAIVALFGLLSRLLGFAREIVLAAAYGTSAVTDALVNGLLIVNSVAAILLYTLVTLIIPVFQRERAERDEASAWALVTALAVWTGIGLVAMASFAAIWPEALAALFNLDAEREQRTAELIRIMAPALALQGFSALFTAMLQIHGKFAGPAAVGVAFNLGIIVATLVGQPFIGIEAAAWGVTLGAVLQILLQLPQFWRLLRAAGVGWTLQHPQLGRVGLLAIPVMTTSLLQQINAFTDRFFAATQRAGEVAALNFAHALGQAPRVALLLPLMTPLFPLIARLMSEGRREDALAAFRRVAGLLAVVAIPMTIVLAVNAPEVAQLAFQRGACDAACTDRIWPPLVFYAFTLWPSFLNLLLNRTLSAGNHQRNILWSTAATVAVTIVLDILLIGPLGIAGLALASAIAVALNTVLLLYLARHHYPGIGLRRFAGRQARVAVAGLLAAGAALGLARLLPTGDLSSAAVAPLFAVKTLVVLTVFAAAAWIVARPEVREGLRAFGSLAGRRPKVG
ncbi:MAG: lipid II flippase MurJ [Miltoncostaeaceae bacterium]